jgi:threonine aldolase
MSTIPQKNSFASDNVTSVCPEVMDAVVEANTGIATSHAKDDYSINLETRFSELFEKDVKVFPVVSGTAANALARIMHE